jgi:Amt family ammonium transporter
LIGLLAVALPAAWADDAPASAAATTSGGAAPEAASPPAAATAAAAPAAAPTAPFLVSADKLSGGDTAWMLTSTALVLMMCIPGLALFYGGMVRKKNVLATLMQRCCGGSSAIHGRSPPATGSSAAVRGCSSTA